MIFFLQSIIDEFWRGKNLTSAQLQKRGFSLGSICLLCGKAEESSIHLFLAMSKDQTCMEYPFFVLCSWLFLPHFSARDD